MKKELQILGLDCANCALKIEKELEKLNFINHVSINFLSEKITIEYEGDFDLNLVKNTIKKVDSDVEVK